MTAFHKTILDLVKVPVERISFRKDKWGEIATVHYGKATKSTTIGDDFDTDELDCFIETVKQGSRSFVSEAKNVYGDNWTKFIKHRN